MQEWNKIADEPDSRLGRGTPTSRSGGSISILDLILILLDRKWFLLAWMTLISTGSVITVVFILDSYYTAEAVVLPSKGKMGSPLGSLMGDMPIGGLLKSLDFMGQGDNNQFLTILESRRLADRVISRFDLVRHYGFHKKKKYYYESLLKEYHMNVKVEEDDKENISIAVTDTNPQFAADMANFIVDELDTISFQIAQSSARGSRIFFEDRLNLIRKVLDSTHHALADFQIKHKFIDLETQVKSTVETLAGIEAEAMATEIQGEMLSTNFGSNSRIVETRRRKEVLDRRLKGYMKDGGGSLVLPLDKTPELGIQYAYLYRDVKVNETLYAYILQMFEQAKFREANNSPVVTVLENATAPQKRARPKRGLVCMLAFFGSFGALSIWVLLGHWYQSQRSLGSDSYYKLQRLFAHFRPAR